MREANQKQTRVQFSGINNEKISGWVCSLQSSDCNEHGREDPGVCWCVTELFSPIPRVLPCSL